MSRTPRHLTRRGFVSGALGGAVALALGPTLADTSVLRAGRGATRAIGPLQDPDANGIRLPAGFRSRIVAVGGVRVRSGLFFRLPYRWHAAADGGATFPTPDGGWVYVSNSEAPAFLGGGVSALRFNRRGRIVNAYRILADTNLNCAGGPTPWGTWLSCEEFPAGHVWECDPLGVLPAQIRPALGTFEHEAVAVDPVNVHLYLTEDVGDGRFYRFVPDVLQPDGRPDLTTGTLQAAIVAADGSVSWGEVPEPNPSLDPAAGQTATRYQVADSTPFAGGEGCWYHDGTVYFTTKGDNRVWALDTASQTLATIYDAATSPTPILTGVDNVTVSESGQVLVAEDGGDMQLVALDGAGTVAPLLQIVGQDSSEITGPAFDPSGRRLYFSSQRGSLRGNDFGLGITYEVSGPFDEILG